MLKSPISALVVLVLAFGAMTAPAVAAGQSSEQQQKADQKRGEAMTKEGIKLAKAKKYVEGRAKLVEATRFGDNRKNTQWIAFVDQKVDGAIKKNLNAAEALYAKGKYAEAGTKLDETLALRKNDSTVLFNRALIAYKMGNKPDAVARLDQALAAGPPDDDRMRLLQLKTQWETGEVLQKQSSEHEQSVKDVNEMLASGDIAPDACTKIRALAEFVTKSASLLVNLAKCAQDEGNLAESARLTGEYLKLAPEAIDQQSVQAGLDEVRDLERRSSPQVIALYAEADRAARQGHYKRAIDAMLKAAAAAPRLPETQLKLARLHQASDNLADARIHYDQYLTLETREALLAAVRQERGVLSDRAKEYDDLVVPVRDRLLSWTHRYIANDQQMGVAAAQADLASIAQQLQEAAVMMPLGPDVNRMLGQVYLYDGNYPAARKAFTIVAESGAPIWFYAVVESLDGWDDQVISKIELRGTEMRVIGLTRINKKSYVPLLIATGESDQIGGFLTSFAPTSAKTPYLTTTTLSKVETDDDFVRVGWRETAPGAAAKGREARLTPVRFASAAPPKGPFARRFANTYTKLFRDFSDQKVELGSERLTAGEKIGMAVAVAVSAYAGGMMSMAGNTQGMANVIAAAMRSTTWATKEIQVAMDTQARMFQETQFKIIPIEDPKPEFRTDLFK